MESKLKHNKKRNTAFLYECLVRELTKSMLEKKNDRRNSIILILKEYFSQETALCEELKVYRQFESDSIEENLADKLINDAKIKYSSIDKIHLLPNTDYTHGYLYTVKNFNFLLKILLLSHLFILAFPYLCILI